MPVRKRSENHLSEKDKCPHPLRRTAPLLFCFTLLSFLSGPPPSISRPADRTKPKTAPVKPAKGKDPGHAQKKEAGEEAGARRAAPEGPVPEKREASTLKSFFWARGGEGEQIPVFYTILFPPEKVAFKEGDDKLTTVLQISGTVYDSDGNPTGAVDGKFHISIPPERREYIKKFPFAVEGGILVPPGRYTVDLEVYNAVSGEKDEIQDQFEAPSPGREDLSFGQPILAYNLIAASNGEKDIVKPFRFPGFRLFPSVSHRFEAGGTLYFYEEIYTSPDGPGCSSLEHYYRFLNEGVEVKRVFGSESEIKPLPGLGFYILRKISLEGLEPGSYLFEAILSCSGREKARRRAIIEVTPDKKILNPWIYTATAEDGSGKTLEEAPGGTVEVPLDELIKQRLIQLKENPESEELRFELADLLYQASDFAGILDVVRPILEKSPENRRALLYAGMCHMELGHFPEAIQSFKKVVDLGVQTPKVYNALALASYNVGDIEGAIHFMELSLKIDPEQPEIEKTYNILKNKK
jgi:hypothetical protein